MIRNAFAAAAALSVALSTVAAHAQAPVRAGAASVAPVSFAPIGRTARTGAKLSNQSDLVALPLWFILAVVVPVTGLGLDALLDLGLIISDDESSPS